MCAECCGLVRCADTFWSICCSAEQGEISRAPAVVPYNRRSSALRLWRRGRPHRNPRLGCAGNAGFLVFLPSRCARRSPLRVYLGFSSVFFSLRISTRFFSRCFLPQATFSISFLCSVHTRSREFMIPSRKVHVAGQRWDTSTPFYSCGSNFSTPHSHKLTSRRRIP